jgi:hypothetical protein
VYPNDLRRFSGALLIPQPLTIHKPRQSGGGLALKANLRFKFEWGHKQGPDASSTDDYYLKRSKGGLFLDFAAQSGERTASGHAQFAWTDRATLITAKLGLPDLSALLAGQQAVRIRGAAVPSELRPAARDSDDEAAVQRKALTVSLTHKPATAGSAADARATTIISYTWSANGGNLRVSKSREQAAQLNLTAAEELRFFRYLDLALDTLLRVGAR